MFTTEEKTLTQYRAEMTEKDCLLMDLRAEVSELQAANLNLSELLADAQLKGSMTSHLRERNEYLERSLSARIAGVDAQQWRTWKDYAIGVLAVLLLIVACVAFEWWRRGQ